MEATGTPAIPWRADVTMTGADSFEPAYVSTRGHIFVGGCGRSGTTLVRVILDSHPNICCGPESKLLLPVPVELPRLERKFKVDAGRLERMHGASRSRAEFVDQFAELCCSIDRKARWAEKTPKNIFCLDHLFRLFPQSRFLHVLRDGRDVACSARVHPRYRLEQGRRVPAGTWHPMETCAQRWRDSLLAVGPHLRDPRVHTVRYEDLVTSPRAAVETLLDFLGEAWDDAVLRHTEAASSFRDVATFPQNPEALAPITTAAVGRWRRDMTPEDKRIFKDVAGDLLVEHGYAADHDW